MVDEDFQAACERCAALCCVVLAFDRSDQFAFDKPALVACQLLSADLRCGVHSERVSRGLGGCAGYDCHGAGQRVVEQVFAGRSWQQEPSLLAPMAEAFRIMRDVCELASLLGTARSWPLTAEQQITRSELERALSPADGWSRERLARFEASSVAGDARRFFRSLGTSPQPTPRRLPLVERRRSSAR